VGQKHTWLTLAIFAAMVALVVIRPRRWNDAWWTTLPAAAMLALGLVAPREAIGAVLAGKNALRFLPSPLALSLLVGKSGFFDWAAIRCAHVAQGDAHALYRNARDHHGRVVAGHDGGDAYAGDAGPGTEAQGPGGTDLSDTQYPDAFQRANFWNATGEDPGNYHIPLDTQTLPPLVIDFPIGSGIPQSSKFLNYSTCAPTVLVDINLFDEYLDYIAIPQMASEGVNSGNFPMFIAGNVLWGAVIGQLPYYEAEAAGYHSTSSVDPAQA
jgi:hypothetical protein